MEREGTNGIPRKLEVELVEAKKWYVEREQLEEAIREHGGSAQRNQEDRDISDHAAARILENIVEAIDETWGFR